MAIFDVAQLNEVADYRRFDSNASLAENEIPEPAANRKKTDKHFLTLFLIFIAISIGCLIYALVNADINRLTNGYDSCGNVCGEENAKYSWDCTGKDMTDKPIYKNGKCVPDYSTYLQNHFATTHRSFLDYSDDSEIYSQDGDPQKIQSMFNYFGSVAVRLTLACILSLGICIVMVYLLRYATAVTVWITLVLSWCCALAYCIFLWFLAMQLGDQVIVAAIVVSIFVLIILCIMVFMRKRVGLVIMLIRESTKAVFDMPQIFFVSAMVVFGLLATTALWAVTTVYMLSAGTLKEISENNLDYVLDTKMVVIIFFNSIIAYWVIQFICGIQYLVISGAVARWYFASNKTHLGKPVLSSLMTTFKFHLGTVALGSLIVTLVAILRAIMRGLARNPRLRILVDCCMAYIEGFLRFLTRNAFIVTAMHGTPFITSGKHAVDLLTLNFCNTIVVNSTGHFVLGASKVLISAASGGITYLMLLDGEAEDYRLYSVAAVVIITVLFVCSILTAIEIVVDTMFLCFCTDCVVNDGINKPYAMPRGLMEFVDGSKKLFADKIEKKGLPTISYTIQ